MAILALVALTTACAPRLQPPGIEQVTPHLTEDYYLTIDGRRLALRLWEPAEAQELRAVVVALHGFNDYSNAFKEPSNILIKKGIAVVAYDQRGFGADTSAGFWAGAEVMASDLRVLVRLVAEKYPGTPLFVLGESMGGAVVLQAFGASGAQELGGVKPAGLILVAPAVWGWSQMNPFYRASLWLAAHTIRGHKVTGSGLDIMPSDNIEMLRGLAADPLVIKKTRIDSIYGLVNLMEDGLQAAANVKLPVLLMYGENDDIIPPKPIRRLRQRLPDGHLFRSYATGYHMLLRDRENGRPLADLADFVLAHAGPGGPARAITTATDRTGQ